MHKNNIDEKIRQALSSNLEIDIDLHSHEQPLLVQAMQIFRGQNWWASVYAMVVGSLFMIFGVYSLYRFYGAVEIKEIVGWSMGFMFSMLTVAMIKIWAWLEMEKYSTIREIKRLELQLSLLNSETPEQDA